MKETETYIQNKKQLLLFGFTVTLIALLFSFYNPYVITRASSENTTVTVTDGMGRIVEITTPINRVVINYPIATEMVFALEAQDKIVGIDTSSQDCAFLNSIKPDVSLTPYVGNPRNLNIEQAIALQPDLFIVGPNEQIVENLEARGITNVFAVVAEDLDQLRSNMINLGKALGKEENAKKFVKYYDETLNVIAQKTSNLKDTERPLVYIAGRDGLLSTCGVDMYQDSIISLTGGKSVGASKEVANISRGWFKVSPEQIINWDPEYILVVQYAADVTPEEILDDPRFQGVSAVRNKKVFWFPSNLKSWDYPAPQAVLGVRWLARLFHTDIFTDFNLKDDADEFFTEFYGKSFTELGGIL